MAWVQLRSKYLDARRFGALPGYARAPDTMYGGGLCYGVQGLAGAARDLKYGKRVRGR